MNYVLLSFVLDIHIAFEYAKEIDQSGLMYLSLLRPSSKKKQRFPNFDESKYCIFFFVDEFDREAKSSIHCGV